MLKEYYILKKKICMCIDTIPYTVDTFIQSNTEVRQKSIKQPQNGSLEVVEFEPKKYVFGFKNMLSL